MFSLGGALIGLQNQANLQGNMWGYAPRAGKDIWSVGSANSGDFWTAERKKNWHAGPSGPAKVAPTMAERGLAQDLPKLGGGGPAPAPAPMAAQGQTRSTGPQQRPYNSLGALQRLASQRG